MGGIVENAKGIMGIVRNGLTTLILILLLFVPATMNKSLIAAGFTEGDIGGFKWKAAVEDNNAKPTRVCCRARRSSDEMMGFGSAAGW